MGSAATAGRASDESPPRTWANSFARCSLTESTVGGEGEDDATGRAGAGEGTAGSSAAAAGRGTRSAAKHRARQALVALMNWAPSRLRQASYSSCGWLYSQGFIVPRRSQAAPFGHTPCGGLPGPLPGDGGALAGGGDGRDADPC